MKTSSLGVAVLPSSLIPGADAHALSARSVKATDERRFMLAWSGRKTPVALLALPWRARRKSERRRHRDPPPGRRFDEYALRDTAGRRVFLGHAVAVCAINDARRDRHHSQIGGDQRVRPLAAVSRAPVLVAELESGGTVAGESAGLEISREIPGAIAFVNRVDVFLEQAPGFDRIARHGPRFGDTGTLLHRRARCGGGETKDDSDNGRGRDRGFRKRVPVC